MTAKRKLLLRHKYPKIVEFLSEYSGISLRKALDAFYNSITYQEIVEGISDMHCRSDQYLAREIAQENKIGDAEIDIKSPRKS